MPVTRIKTNQLTDNAVTSAKIAALNVTAGKLENNMTYGSNLTVSGNLTVNGTTTTVDTTNTSVSDPLMLLSSGGAGNVDGGIIINRGSAGNNAVMLWDESEDQFGFGLSTESGTTAGNVTIASYGDLRIAGLTTTGVTSSGTITGNVTGNLTGNVTGNLDGIIGGNTAAAGSFTTIGASGAITASGGVTGNVTGNLTGNVTGNITSSGTSTFATADINTALTVADITVDASSTVSMGSNAITNVADPSNAQDAATKAYVDAQLSGAENKIFQLNTNVEVTDTGTNGTITFNVDGSSEGTINSDGLTIGNINVDGNTIKTTSGNLTIDPASAGVGGTVTIAGSLTVTGTTTTVDSTTVSIADPIFELGDDSSDDNLDRGIKMKYNNSGAKIAFMGFDDSASEFIMIADATDTSSVFSGSLSPLAVGSIRVTDLTSGRVPFAGASGEISDSGSLTFDGTTLTSTFSGNITGNVTGNVTGNLDGIIGANTAAAGSFTTIGASGAITASGGVTGNVTGNLTGNVTGNVTGNIDGIVGGNTPAAGTFTTIGTSGEATLASATISDLTDNRVMIAGTAGAIEDSANLTFDGSTLAVTGTVTASTGAVIGGTSATAGATLKVDSTDSIMIPVGTTGQRPGSPATGMLRFNTTIGQIEIYDGTSFNAGADFTVIEADSFNGDDSTTAFTLSVSGTTATTLVMLNGVVQIPTTAYAVSGTTLTFTEAPATGDVIDARVLTTTDMIVGISDTDGDTKVEVERTSDSDTIEFRAGGNYVASIGSSGVEIEGNYSFTLGGNMDANAKNITNLATPSASSHAATKGYVDGELAGLSQNSISQGDSSVAVSDSGTGSVVVTVDNATHTTFNSSGITLASGVFSGTATSAQYADLAEMYSADADIEPGTVVCFGGDAEVTTCMADADKKIAGVVSTNPAYLMNSDAEGVAVALQGRVPCKVTGAIAKGDMLVSAGNGMARAEENPAMGTVIGKALEDHAEGEGVIEVVVGRM